ncbi:MAG: nucleotidyl transferase AbiEii/AbiGii toxin family protein [Vicinamibacterales bacterium]
MDPAAIRRTAIIAMFSDDVLMNRLVLKGGNALDIVHGLSARGSLDIDFSIEGDFDDLEDIKNRIFHALRDRFDSAGLIVFDERFEKKPNVLQEGQDEHWGGYRVEFKVIAKVAAARLENSLERMQRSALVVGPRQERIFQIEISKYEFCGANKIAADLDAYTIYVYPPQMIAAEKVRAICQQMPDYPQVRNKRARARDFYDIHTIVTRAYVDFGSQEFHDLIREVFDAKTVPLPLIGKIQTTRDFHAVDWPSVVLSVPASAGQPQPFDYYFDFVRSQVKKLEPLWEI